MKLKRTFVLMEQNPNEFYIQGDIVSRGLFEGEVVATNKNNFVLACDLTTTKELFDKHNKDYTAPTIEDYRALIKEYKNIWFTN